MYLLYKEKKKKHPYFFFFGIPLSLTQHLSVVPRHKSICPSVCVFLVFQTNNFKIVYQCTENFFWGFSTNPKVTQQRDPIIFYVQLYTRDTIQLTNQSNHPAIPEHKKLTLEANPKAEFIVSAGKFMSISFSFFSVVVHRFCQNLTFSVVSSVFCCSKELGGKQKKAEPKHTINKFLIAL